jgi:hypothetical protein
MSETVKGLISFATEMNRFYKNIIFGLRQNTGFLLCMITAMFLSFYGGPRVVMRGSGYWHVLFMYDSVLC